MSPLTRSKRSLPLDSVAAPVLAVSKETAKQEFLKGLSQTEVKEITDWVFLKFKVSIRGRTASELLQLRSMHRPALQSRLSLKRLLSKAEKGKRLLNPSRIWLTMRM